MKDGLGGDFHIRCGGIFCPLPIVGVAVIGRKVAAGNFNPDTVTFFEQIAGHANLDFVAVDFVRLDRARVFKRLTEPGADDTVAQVDRFAAWMYINQFDCEISVQGGRSSPQHSADRAGDLCIRLQRRP